MAITAQNGVFGLGFQAGGAKDGAVATWHRHRALNVDMSILDDNRMGPGEVGGIVTPTMPYKAGYAVGGGATIMPRFKETLGWFLLAALGEDTVVTGKDIDDASVVGLNRHTMAFKATDQAFVPYVSFRKLIPHTTAASILGEIYKNCKILGLTIDLANEGPVSMRLDAAGTDFTLAENPTWTWAATYEDWRSVPITCVTGGSVKFTPSGGSEKTLQVISASIGLVNGPLDFRQEKIIGDPRLDGITVVDRSISFDLMVKWNDPDLYQEMLTGAAAGTTWDATPFIGEIEITTVSSADIGTAPLNVPWKFRVGAPEVQLRQVGGVTLAAGQSLVMRLQGTAIEPASGNYCSFIFHNEKATAYAVP